VAGRRHLPVGFHSLDRRSSVSSVYTQTRSSSTHGGIRQPGPLRIDLDAVCADRDLQSPIVRSSDCKEIRHWLETVYDCAELEKRREENVNLSRGSACGETITKVGELTSGSGHNGSHSFSTSPGFMTSILTSCANRTLRPALPIAEISKLSTACLDFLASLTRTSSGSRAVDDDADEDADLRTESRADVGMQTVITLDALD
jgi:hypothetical protein